MCVSACLCVTAIEIVLVALFSLFILLFSDMTTIIIIIITIITIITIIIVCMVILGQEHSPRRLDIEQVWTDRYVLYQCRSLISLHHLAGSIRT